MMPLLPLAERYARFREDVFAGAAEHPPLASWDEPLTELELQSLWFGGEFGSEFTTEDGQRLVIRDFGTWNSGAGPDFSRCAIEIGGSVIKGDIELDPDVRDWERHGHGGNVEFDRVVLHVFLHGPAGQEFFTRTASHRGVSQVRLSREMLEGSALPARKQAAAHLGRCAAPLGAMAEDKVASMIEAAAQYRVQRKSARLRHWAASQGREQAVYQALAQTMGYRKNQRPFLVLSQRLPLREMLKKSAPAREALLFGVSGFLEGVRAEDTQPETRRYLRDLWSSWWKQRDACLRWLEPQNRLRWKLNAIRPGNHPQRRLGSLAAMLSAWPQVSAPLIDATRWSQAGWRQALLGLSHDFWSTHYTLPRAKPLALIGETRVQEMLANVAYPLLLHERPRLWAEYLELPSLLGNQKLSRAVLRLFGESARGAAFQKKLHHQQGLLQIYEDFCLEDSSACAGCPFPERLKNWS
jgi:hypothetical protein